MGLPDTFLKFEFDKKKHFVMLMPPSEFRHLSSFHEKVFMAQSSTGVALAPHFCKIRGISDRAMHALQHETYHMMRFSMLLVL